MPAVLATNLDYTNKDQDAIERRLRSLIEVAFPNWSEHAKANFGNILVGLFAHVGDQHSYYVDKFARESRISVAQLRRSLLGLVKLINYSPQGASAATVDAEFTLSTAAANNVTILAGTVVRTQDVTAPVSFQLLADLTILAGNLTGVTSVEHTVAHQEILVSDGLPNQSFRLNHTPFVDQSPTSPVTVFANGAYVVVDNFLDSTSSDKHVALSVDSNDRATLRFGNGTNGAIPVGNGTVDYKTGGGSEGLVEANSITAIDGSFTDTLGNPVTVTVNNELNSQGGAPRESNAEIRINAPKASRVLKRAIAREDYEIVAELVAGVARALSVTKNEDPAVAENAGIVFVIPDGGGTASQAILDSVLGRFEQVAGQPAPTHPTINTFNLQVLTASYLDVDHVVRAHVANGYTSDDMKTAVETVLADFYGVTIKASRLIEIAPKAARDINVTAADGDSVVDNPLVNFGFFFKDSDGDPTGVLPWTDVLNIIRDLDEVRKLDASQGLLLNGVRADVLVGTFKFPRLGSLSVIDGDTGNVLV